MATRYPVSPVSGMREAVDRLFNETFFPARFQTVWSAGAGSGDRSPLPLDVYATADDVVILAAVPGLRPEDIEISVEKNTVTISGQIPNVARSDHARDASWYLHELPSGSFRRSLTLPRAEAAKPRQIRVQAVTSGEQSEPAIGEEATSKEANG